MYDASSYTTRPNCQSFDTRYLK